jgi:hypothetical protein
LIRRAPTTFRIYPRPSVVRTRPAHAELGQGASVGSSTGEVNILAEVRAAPKPARQIARFSRSEHPSGREKRSVSADAGANPRLASRLCGSSRIRAQRIRRRRIRRPEVSAAARTDPELILLPRRPRRRITHLHLGSTALATQTERRHTRIVAVWISEETGNTDTSFRLVGDLRPLGDLQLTGGRR